jgi:hypothetical protein
LENIDLIEGVQRSFTRRLPGLSNLSYPDRLIVTNLPSLEIRRIRNDCILLYNILHGRFYCINNMFTLRDNVVSSSVVTRGNNYRLFISHVNSNIVKYAFFHRTAMSWNILDNNVISAPNCKLFNERLLDIHLLPFLRGRALM